MGFRLIPSSMTLNDLERRNSPYFSFFSPNSIAFNYITLVEDRPIISAKYYLSVPVFHFWPKVTHPAARSLCDKLLVYSLFWFRNLVYSSNFTCDQFGI